MEGLAIVFGAGLASAASPCLLPLYPGYIAYLGANSRALEGRRATGLIGLIVLFGVMTTMLAVALLLVAISAPMGPLLAVLTPLVDGILIVLGIMLILGRNPFEKLPGMRVPDVANPYRQAYLYGIMLGPIALPCAGPFLGALLAISLGVPDAIGKVGTFVIFGLGFGLPLVLLSLLAGVRARQVVGWIIARHRQIELGAGTLLVVIGIYDLVTNWDSIQGSLGL